MRRLGIGVHAPLDLGAQQRMQTAQVDLRRAEHRVGRRAPAPERGLVAVEDRDRVAAAFVAVGPLGRQGRPTGPALGAVPALVPSAQAQRRVRQLRADPNPAAAVARIRLLPGEPAGEVRVAAVEFAVPEPAELMLVAQHQRDIARRALRADPARPLVSPGGQPGRPGGAQEIGLQLAVPLRVAPQLQVSRAQIAMARLRPLAAGDQAVPAEDRMAGRDRDDLRAEQRVEGRRADQRDQDLQPVPASPVIQHRQQRRHRHLVSPHAARSAASNAGSCTSACP